MNDAQSKNLFHEMEISMKKHSFLAANPILTLIENGTEDISRMTHALAQYSVLPAKIVELLARCRKRVETWGEVYNELSINIGEELGSKTGGFSHYRILLNRLKDELGADFQEVVSSSSTKTFLDELFSAIANKNQAFVAGIAYALEDSATPELLCVAPIVNAYARLTGQPLPIREETLEGKGAPVKVSTPEEGLALTLDDFWSMHVLDFEPGHRDRLAVALEQHLDQNSRATQDFKQGFEFVLTEMDEWWKKLAKETI